MAKQYGDVLRQLRETRGWSQDEIATRAKVSRETVWRAEQSGNVGVLLLYRIAHVLDVDISVLFGGHVRREEPAPGPPSVWGRLKREQRAEVERYARRLVGERVPPEST